MNELSSPFDPGSEAAPSAAIFFGLRKGDHVLLYGWEPTVIMGRYDTVILKGLSYDKKMWEGNCGCDMDVRSNIYESNSNLMKSNPDITEMLDKYTSTIDQMNGALADMTENNTETEEIALCP